LSKIPQSFWLFEAELERGGSITLELFGTHGGVMSFVMGEYWSKPYTNQYVSCDGRFFVRPVDALDQSTWITRDEITAFLAGQPQTPWQRRIEESKRNVEPSR
jgi:hypothetical protein